MGKLRQEVRWATDRKVVGCLLPDDQCTKTRRPVAEVFNRSTRTRESPPVENPMCAAFEEYGEVPEMVPLDFTKDDVTWVASKISSAANVLGAEAIEMIDWLLRFSCAPEEIRVVISRLADWLTNSSPPWSAYCALMACRLVVLDNRPGLCPVEIGETIRQALPKLVMREAGDQAKTTCGIMQLCADL